MKPVFGIDITNKDNETVNADVFEVANISCEKEEKLENAGEELENLVSRAKLPFLLRLISGICGPVGVVLIAGFVRAIGEIGLKQSYHNAPWIVWGIVVCLVTWVALFLFSRHKRKKVMESSPVKNRMSSLDKLKTEIYRELDVPKSAHDVDILLFCYKQKDGQPIAKSVGWAATEYVNQAMKAFVRDDHLYLADLHTMWAFPLSELRAIRTVSKRIRVPGWNKDVPHKDASYKAYKITQNDVGAISFKPYHILELEHGGETWGIYFPCYDLPVLERLTGMHAEE